MDNYFIYEVIKSLLPFINEINTYYLTKEEIKDKSILYYNCGINADILFSLFSKNKNINYIKNIEDIKLNKNYIYKLYNIWNKSSGGHPHASIVYYLKDKWIFFESSEYFKGIDFVEHNEKSLLKFLKGRQNISIWQEIIFAEKINKKSEMMINKEKWLNENI